MQDPEVEVEHTELDNLLLDIHERQQQAEAEAAEASEANNKKLDKERQEAEETRRLSMEGLSETQKRSSNSDNDFDVISRKQKKSRSSGTDTIAYLREKTEKDLELRAVELKFKTHQLDMEKQRQEASQNHMEILMQSSQQQMNAIFLLVGKLTRKL